jgi:EmrB/QacA subfamily drug resistance transporter
VAVVSSSEALAASRNVGRSEVLALAAMALGIFVVANDFTALSVAIVDIEQDLETTLNRAQWVINAYTVVFGVLIVTGGRLADIFGRKRIFLIGATIFAAFSLLAAFAVNIEMLIAARALMGVGGAMMWPSVLGMTYAILGDDRAALAGGLVIGVAGLGNALGPLIAGSLTDSLGWEWIFVVNVPVAAVAMLATWFGVDDDEALEAEGIDVRGIALLSGAVVLILVALDVGTNRGFTDPLVIALLVIGVVLLPAFVVVERGVGASALVPPRIMGNRDFIGALGTVVFVSAIYFAVLVFIPQYLQNELDWSALSAGAGLLPLMLTFAVVSFAAGPVYNVLGARPVVVTGAVCLTVGVFLLALNVGGSYPPLVPGLVIVGVGVGMFFSAITTAAVTAVDADDSSLAGGIIYMGNVAGGSIGIGLNTAIVLAASELADGIETAYLVDAALGLVGVVCAALLVHGDAGRWHPLHRIHHRAHG